MSITRRTDPSAAPAALDAVARTLGDLAGGGWWRTGERDLTDVLQVLGQVRHELARVEVHAMAEVINRGMPQDRCLSAVDYLAQAEARQAPQPAVGHALMVVRLAEALNSLAGPGLGSNAGPAANGAAGAHAPENPGCVGPDAACAGHTAGADAGHTAGAGGDEHGAGAGNGAGPGPGGGPGPDHGVAGCGTCSHERRDFSPVAETLAAFDAGLMGPSRAAAIIRFHDEVKPHSTPEQLASAMGTINQGATDSHRPRGIRMDPLGLDRDPESIVRRHGWTDRELRVMLGHSRKVIKPVKEKDDEERRGRAFRSLHTLPVGQDLTEYRLVVEPEGAAIIDAAVAALSAPEKDPDGALDLRTASQRKADALVTIIQRGVAAPEGVPQTTKAQVMITIPLTELLGSTTGAGVTMTGQVLAPQTVRRMACDAALIPVVLGTKGEILDMGHEKRLFTPAQRRALWHRDEQCTFPGCTTPPQWCDAHHVIAWERGGPTDLANGALLCQRHHTYVHSHDLSATVDEAGVTWHT